MATPFSIHIDQSAVDDLYSRLKNTRLPDHLPGSHWDYGTEPSYLQVIHGQLCRVHTVFAVSLHACHDCCQSHCTAWHT